MMYSCFTPVQFKQFMKCLVLLLILLGACLGYKKEPANTKNSNASIISGKAPDKYVNKKIYLQYINKDSVYTDTAIVDADGKFEFGISKIEYPAKAFISDSIMNFDQKLPRWIQLGQLIYFQFGSPTIPEQFGSKQDVRFLLLEKGKMVLDITDSIYNSNTDGSKLNAELEELADMLNPVMHELNKNTETDVSEYLTKKSNILDKFINDHRQSFVSVLAINIKPNLVTSDLEVFNKIDPQIRNSSFADISRIKLAPFLNPVHIDDVVENFKLRDLLGNIVSLYDIKSQYILIDFWASWCIPCREENRKIAKFYSQYNQTDFQIVGISIDENKEKWLRALKKDNVKWISLHDPEKEINDRLGVNAYPTNFLLDSGCKVLDKDLGSETLMKRLNELL